MPAKDTVTARVDADVKSEAKRIYAEMGLNLSAAVSLFLAASVKCNGFPFDPSSLPQNAPTPPEGD